MHILRMYVQRAAAHGSRRRVTNAHHNAALQLPARHEVHRERAADGLWRLLDRRNEVVGVEECEARRRCRHLVRINGVAETNAQIVQNDTRDDAVAHARRPVFARPVVRPQPDREAMHHDALHSKSEGQNQAAVAERQGVEKKCQTVRSREQDSECRKGWHQRTHR